MKTALISCHMLINVSDDAKIDTIEHYSKDIVANLNIVLIENFTLVQPQILVDSVKVIKLTKPKI